MLELRNNERVTPLEAILIKLEALWTRLDTGHRNESMSDRFEGLATLRFCILTS